MTRILTSPWITALIGGILYLATTVTVVTSARFDVSQLPGHAEMSPDDAPSWKFKNPEFNQWIAQIKNERDAMALKEQQLDELQQRIEAERQEIMTVTQTVSQLQAEFDKNVIRFKSQETENVRRQAKLISSMSPEGAAAMVAEMNDNDVVRILFVMKADEASQLLDTLAKMGQAKRAATLTEKLHQVLPADSSTVSAKIP